MTSISLGSIGVEVLQKDIKNIHLSVLPPLGAVRIAAPLHLSVDTIRLYAISKLSWIKKQQKKIKGQARQSRREFINKESHFFMGRRYLLRVIEGEGRQKVVIKSKTVMELHTKPSASQQDKQSVINEWYRGELKKLIPPLIAKWEAVIGVRVCEYGVKQMKTKWGSCNREAGRIWLNLELAKKPLECIEYIIVHEMIHLLERRHGDRFFAYLDKFLPQWRQRKEELSRLPLMSE